MKYDIQKQIKNGEIVIGDFGVQIYQTSRSGKQCLCAYITPTAFRYLLSNLMETAVVKCTMVEDTPKTEEMI